MSSLSEHPWRGRPADRTQIDRDQAEALWAIAAELRELNERMEENDD